MSITSINLRPFIVSAIHWGILSSLALLSSLDVSSLFQSPDWSSGSKVTLGSSPWNCSSNDTSLSTLTMEISASEVAGVLSDLCSNGFSDIWEAAVDPVATASELVLLHKATG